MYLGQISSYHNKPYINGKLIYSDFRWCINLNFGKWTLMTGFVVQGHISATPFLKPRTLKVNTESELTHSYTCFWFYWAIHQCNVCLCNPAAQIMWIWLEMHCWGLHLMSLLCGRTTETLKSVWENAEPLHTHV